MATNGCAATREAVDELVEARGEVTCPLCDQPASAHEPEPRAIAYTSVTADDWVMVDQRAEDDNETASDGGEL